MSWTTATVQTKQTLTAQDTFSAWVSLRGNADISASGIATSTVTVQRSFDGGVTVKDVESFAADFERVLEASEQGAMYRVGIKAGNYGSDTVLVEISQ